jgi:6-phosphogluconolactonase (cycloisomerase 2 family)
MKIAALGSALALAAVLAAVGPARADRGGGSGGRVVWVQTNDPTGNQVVVYDRAGDGRLTQAGAYATGGDGGVALPGTESDHLASQGSLVYDHRHQLLFAVNAGSDTLSVFRVHHDRLALQQILPSGGGFPASIAVDRNVLYVLNSGDIGTLQGFRIHGHRVHALPGSARTLGLANSDPPMFLTSPGQVGFTPDGRQLLVTTKASGDMIDVFSVGPDGLLSATPTGNNSATPVPFAFTFQPGTNRLVDGEAGASAVTTYVVQPNGVLSDPRSQTDGQAALCWITRARNDYYVSNTGSNTISGYRIRRDGQPALIAGVAGTTELGPVDSAESGRFLYVQTGTSGTVDEFKVENRGSLTKLGVVTGLPAGQEGIAAS